MLRNDETVPEPEGEQNMNMSTRPSDCHPTVTGLVESTAPTQQASSCMDAQHNNGDQSGESKEAEPTEIDSCGLSDREQALLTACVLSLRSFRRLYDVIEDDIVWQFGEFSFLEGLERYWHSLTYWPLSRLREAIEKCGIRTTQEELEEWLRNTLPALIEEEDEDEEDWDEDDWEDEEELQEECDADMENDGEQGDVR